jgi:O-antigen/teichoic acid export membrane protein
LRCVQCKKILVPKVYFSSFSIVGILAWQSLFYGAYLIVSVGIWKAEKTQRVVLYAGMAVILNMLLNFMLVPKFGGVGAAISSAISHMVWVVSVLIASEKLWPVGYPRNILFCQVTVGAIGTTFIIYGYLTQASMLSIAIVTHTIFILLVLSSVKASLLKKMVLRIVYKYTRLNNDPDLSAK